jgi:hypothetical protein
MVMTGSDGNGLWLRFLLIGALCGIGGMGAGIAMGAARDFALAPAHAHLNLLGFVAMSLYGLFYRVAPAGTASSGLARLHFWLAVIGLAVMLPALFWLLLGHPAAEPAVIAGAFVTLAALIVFALVVLRCARRTDPG